MLKPHVFVTGGTGFIGARLCARLLAEGYPLTVLTRDIQRARRLLPEQVRLIDDFQLLTQGKPVQAVINLAGEPLADRRWNEKRKLEFYSSRVGLTEKLYEYFASATVAAPEVLISGSAVGYYGPKGEEFINESSSPTACFSSNLCRAWESMACQFENLGTRVCRIRTGLVLGPNGGVLKAMLPAFKLGLGGPIGSGQQWMPWIHLDDMVEVIAAALANGQLTGAINATAPTPVTNRAFAWALGSALSRPALLPMPAVVVRALFGEMADELLLSGQRAIPQVLLDNNFTFRYPEVAAALDSILKRH